MRAILIDWLVEVHYKFRVSTVSPLHVCFVLMLGSGIIVSEA